jgi:hypothetical protein
VTTVRKKLKRMGQRLMATPFATIIGVIGVNAAINLMLRPQASPTHQLLSPFDYLSTAIYGIGGLAILVGIAMRRTDVEAAGCIGFAGGSLIAAVTWAFIVGWGSWNQVLVLTVFCIGSLIRAYHLAKGQVLVLIELPQNGHDLPKVVEPSG